jgi:ubiquinone/menaquinone biosynthesis C-methylase UbiE
MHGKSARIYDDIYSFEDYQVTARRLSGLIEAHRPGAKSLLDVACGTGKHLEILRNRYEVEGSDVSPEMLEISRARCPGVQFHLADMAELSIGRTFDAVSCLYSSIGYMTTLERMERAIAAMAGHVAPGGALFVEPWFGPDNYWTETAQRIFAPGRPLMEYVDRPDLKIACIYRTEREERLTRFLFHFLVGTPQKIEYYTEIHDLGLFTDQEYVEAFRKAGLTRIVRDPQGAYGRGMFIGTRNER